MDFAFFFETREEALQNAGPVVAAAWAIARHEAQQGLAVRVRDPYDLQAPGAKPSIAPPPVKAKPSAAPRVVAGKTASSAQPLPQRNAQFRPTLVDILVQDSRYAEQLQSPEASGIVSTIVDTPLNAAEPATLTACVPRGETLASTVPLMGSLCIA